MGLVLELCPQISGTSAARRNALMDTFCISDRNPNTIHVLEVTSPHSGRRGGHSYVFISVTLKGIIEG